MTCRTNVECRETIRFCILYPTYTDFKVNVIDQLLLFDGEPVITWETLYNLLFRRFKQNVFKARYSEWIHSDFQEVLDRRLDKYNSLWEVNLSDWLNNKTYEELLAEGLYKETTSTDSTTDRKDSPQTKDVVELDLDYLTDRVNSEANANRETETQYSPVYEKIRNAFVRTIYYELEAFYYDISDIFMTTFGVVECDDEGDEEIVEPL